MDAAAVYENFRRALGEHYFDLTGRVSRLQFWYFVVAGIALSVGAMTLTLITGLPFNLLLGLALLLPTAGMGARRLQDTGRDGRLVWFLMIPLGIVQVFSLLAVASGPFGVIGFLTFFFSIGWLLNLVILASLVVLIFFWIQPGDAGPNRYGPPPVGIATIITP